MKRNAGFWIGLTLIVLLMAAVVGYYIYEVAVLGTAPTENLGRAALIFLALCGSLAKLLTRTGRSGLNVYEQAYKDELGQAFQNDPAARKKLLEATRLYNEDKYDKAVKGLAKLLDRAESVADRSPVLLFIALCYTDAGLRADAIEVYKDLLKYDPRHAQAHGNLGLLYANTGDFEAARHHYDCAISYRPDNYYGFVNRANLLFRMGECDDALTDALKALEIKNNGKEAANLLTVLYALAGDEENRKKYRHMAIAAGADPQSLDATVRRYLSEAEE